MEKKDSGAHLYKLTTSRGIVELFQRLSGLEQRIRGLLEDLNAAKGELHKLDYTIRGEILERIDKPWGHEEILERNSRYAMKTLHIRAGEELSLQYHEIKHETIYCASGKGSIMVDNEVKGLSPGAYVVVPPAAKHKIRAVENLVLVEASTPELEDVVRLKDKHGRPTELP